MRQVRPNKVEKRAAHAVPGKTRAAGATNSPPITPRLPAGTLGSGVVTWAGLSVVGSGHGPFAPQVSPARSRAASAWSLRTELGCRVVAALGSGG